MGTSDLSVDQPPAGALLRPLPIDQSGEVTPSEVNTLHRARDRSSHVSPKGIQQDLSHLRARELLIVSYLGVESMETN